ncbi:FAD-dependent oxidoreductase [Mycoplasma sp. 21DD0573]|uniref:NAD(P)/FAD-dependent oxidoreductase n=1 Tax=unclassified Mycoplasma TaxID=2683645 RepID=UPI002B1DD4F6|nr:FAD-dependent oxidoreductase [Mycoplasma sp. 21DD0573]MEA4276536.1 FAD-dependent oxidoreductase [Mycoplasma sp. 21DD0573]
MNGIYDLVIIGGGPAGLNAALYASRANLNVAFIEKGAPGGKLSSTAKVENWLGTSEIEGWKLAQEFFDHAKEYGAKYLYGTVTKINNLGKYDKEIVLSDGSIVKAKSVLIATGMINRRPTFIPEYDRFEHFGISYCVVCDAPLFGKNPSVVLGDGNSAVEESIYLSRIASEVNLVIRDETFKADKVLVKELLRQPNIKVFKNSQIVQLLGDRQLEGVVIENKNGEQTELKVSSFFPYIGFESSAWFAQDLGILDEKGFIVTNDKMETNVPGIYAAGDIRQTKVRQIVTAASDGAVAARSIIDYLS